MTAYTIVVHVLALVGLLSILASVGVWIFSARIDEPRRDVTDVLAEPSNVRVIGTFGHGSPTVETCEHCGEPASHSCDLDDFIAHQARLSGGAS